MDNEEIKGDRETHRQQGDLISFQTKITEDRRTDTARFTDSKTIL
jgi:hypothetical protein